MPEDWEAGGFGLYVHWPFCAAKCPYCDFNSHVTRHIDHDAWAVAYGAEIARISRLVPGRRLNTIYFGGGTPSLMQAQTVERVIAAAQRYWRLDNDAEITLEANPGSVEAERFADYRRAGVNRISMGIQALNDPDLRRLGRIHTAAEARAAFAIARDCFEQVSFDLIYGRQDQTLDAWIAELEAALALAVDHISLYQLTVEDGTAFADRLAAGKLRGLPGEDLSADMYEATEAICAAHGLRRYEVSNFARPGAESRHNMIYWRGGDYAGVGPGAHGRLTYGGTRRAMSAWREPGKWLYAVQNGSGEAEVENLSSRDRADEYLMMGLRTAEGISMRRYAALGGSGIVPAKLAHLRDLGVISCHEDRIIVSDQGVMVLNAVIAELAAN